MKLLKESHFLDFKDTPGPSKEIGAVQTCSALLAITFENATTSPRYTRECCHSTEENGTGIIGWTVPEALIWAKPFFSIAYYMVGKEGRFVSVWYFLLNLAIVTRGIQY